MNYKLINKTFNYLQELMKNIKTSDGSMFDENKTSGYYWNIPDDHIFSQQEPLTVQVIPAIYLYFDGLTFPNDGQYAASFGQQYQVGINYSIGIEIEIQSGENDLLIKGVAAISDILTVLHSDIYLREVSNNLGDTEFELDHHVITNVNSDGALAYPKAYFEVNGIMLFYNIHLNEL